MHWEDFDRYVFLVLELLKKMVTDLMMMKPYDEEKTGEGQVQKDHALTEYHDNLCTSLLVCYTAIIQGLRVSKKHDLVLSALDSIHLLLQHCAEYVAATAVTVDGDKKASWGCKQAAWDLLLDVGKTYGLCNTQCKNIFLRPFVLVLIDIGKLGRDHDQVSASKSTGDGLIRTLGTSPGYTNLFYCGRSLGSRAIPGSDGQCGPNNGPQCTACVKYQREQGYIPPTLPDASKLAAIQMESIVKQLHSVESGSNPKVDTTVTDVKIDSKTIATLMDSSISSVPIPLRGKEGLYKKRAGEVSR